LSLVLFCFSKVGNMFPKWVCCPFSSLSLMSPALSMPTAIFGIYVRGWQ
jgi:hypothetical protein